MTPPLTVPDVLGLLAMVALMAAAVCVVSYARLPRGLKLLFYAALALRVVGAWLRYKVYYEVYDRNADAGGYYQRGLEYADRFRELDFSPFFDQSLWFRGEWWGTSFVSFPSGIILTGIGPSFLGEFVAFSLLGFVGLVGFAVAFRETSPGVPVARYARWIWFFPSLWFWPSSVGKEAIVLMGLGLAVAGFIGRREKINWPLLIVGTFFVFAIRPQVAAVVIFSFIMAHWLSQPGRWTMRKVGQGLLILVAGLGGIWFSMNSIGVGGFDVEGVHSYLESQTAVSTKGTTVEVVGVRWAGIPLALINVLLRPFVWEANNMMMLFAAIEVLLFGAIVWYRRYHLLYVLRHWRADRFLTFALPFIIVYATLLGMLTINLGIIARQRIFIYPCLFLLLEAMPAAAQSQQAPVRRAQQQIRALAGISER